MDQQFDLKAFWRENEKCFVRFSTDKPRAPLLIGFEDHFMINFVPMESTIRYYMDPAYTIDMNCHANDILEREIGARFYPEDNIYYIKGIFEILMGARRIINERNTPWIKTSIEDIEGVKKLIRYAENWDPSPKAIPDSWREEKEKLMKQRGKHLHFAHMMNGPATVASNILGITNLCIFIMEEPEVMDEFFRVMSEKYIAFYETALLEDHGVIAREGLWVNDDNCYLFSPSQYERFCAPFLQKMYDNFAPLPHHLRRQHSDSAMGHLMGILNDLGVNEVNLGPEIHPLAIRKALPRAVIHGQMPPFVLRDGTKEEITAYIKRDFEAVGMDGGLTMGLAGVTPESTPMENIRHYMYEVARLTKYK